MFGKKKQKAAPVIDRRKMARYLLPVDVWAIAFGCSVGWGAFIMPATTFLPIAGPAGTLLAMLLSTALMLVIGYNYAWLMKNRPRKGGVYTFTKEALGRDHAFLCSWFLSLSYLTIVFLNATALFIISRILFANIPQIGFSCEVGGLTIYPGEIALSVCVLVVVGILLIREKPFMQMVQRILAILLFAGAVILTVASLPHFQWRELLTAFGTGGFGNAGLAETAAKAGLAGAGSGAIAQGTGSLRAAGAVMTLLLLAPWAFVGFEIASLETPHFDFPIRWSWRVMACAILSAGFVYTAMTFVSAAIRPPQYASWQAYVLDLDALAGIEGVPTFYAAWVTMGKWGMAVITVTALAAILTGVIGAYRATIRMLSTMAEDKILSREFRGTTFCIVFIMGISSAFTFLGRSTLDWFVELTSFGATVGFAYTSLAAAMIAGREHVRSVCVTGWLGAVVSAIFAVVQLASRVASVETMCAPSFLMLAIWCLLGFVFYWRTMRQSDLSDFDGVTVSSSILFCLLLYSVLKWFTKLLADAVEEAGAQAILPAVRRNGLVLMVFVIVGLAVMVYTQRWLRIRQAQLEREKMQAEESSKAKSQFLFNMSHDIRTPMNAIIGYTHLAGLEEDVPPRVREYIEKIDISGKHLLTLINDVLEMSRIESGKMELMNEPGDICEAMQTAYEMFQDQMQGKEIEYTLDIRDVGDPYVLFDRNRFLRVVLNLVSNAYKFTPEGGHVALSLAQVGGSRWAGGEDGGGRESPGKGAHGEAESPGPARRSGKGGQGRAAAGETPQVFAHGEEPAGGEASDWGAYEIRVRDDGIGMTREFAETVFEAFARERTSTVSRIQGTGLGMAITKSIVDAMQGAIDVETAPDEGTEFIIRVPYPICQPPVKDGHAFGPAALDGAPQGITSRRGEGREDGGGDAGRPPAGTAGPDAASPAGGRDAGKGSRKTASARPEEGVAAGGNGGRRGRILVAEDMEINRQIVEMLLMNIGFRVEMAEDGRQAVDMVAASAPGYYDAVLMDIQMPVMDGYEASEAIRRLEDPALSGIPIIAVTANAFGEDVRKAREKGMNGHISKPIDPAQMEKTLARILGK